MPLSDHSGPKQICQLPPKLRWSNVSTSTSVLTDESAVRITLYCQRYLVDGIVSAHNVAHCAHEASSRKDSKN